MSRKQQYLFLNFGLAISILLFINVLYFSTNNWDVRRIFYPQDSVRLISTSKLPVNLTKGIKRILFWTEYFGHEDFPSLELGPTGVDVQRQFCDYGCEFTTNKELISSSDALIFHGRDLKTESFEVRESSLVRPNHIPTERNASQYWIFYLLESPVNTFVPLEAFNNFFNLTMTYRTDSDIYVPYQRLVKITETELQNETPNRKLLQKKSKMVAWIVSNCETQSKRELLVKELKKYIQVDVYGSCGENSCSSHGRDNGLACYEEIGKSYKFYLSFENTLCTDYVTEKFFNALATGMVPIVYGGANYSQHAPKGSYIDARSFSSMKELASYLLNLDKYDKLYLKYFQWKKHFRVENVTVLQRSWCRLCRALSTGEVPLVRTVSNLKSWWMRYRNSTVCTTPDLPETLELL
ncbi:unnamed protein product [Allacma fusca]|uniref:Fucosyltransferase n=1 Tax=Allacma fusca TaxID=39272 RepID=A0A8J2KXK0_9HEXA|nr:unnamed protein product [Allacma fusca]